MHKYPYFLLLSIVILGLGCYLVIAGSKLQATDWPMFLGAVCLIVAICIAALMQALQAQHHRIVELEKKLAEKL